MSNPLNGILGSSGGGSGGSGDVVGPASSTDNAVARWDLATGKLLQDSALIVSDVAAGAITVTSTAGTAITLKNTDPAATTGASVAGDPLTITAGNAVASTDTAGAAAGGAVTITSGAAARNTSGNANGGDINLTTGAGIGTGTTGKVVIPSAAGLNWSTDTGLARSAAGVVKVTDGGAGAGSILVKGGATSASIRFGGSTAAEPALGSHASVSTGNVHVVKADVSDWSGINATEFRFANTGRGYGSGGGAAINTSFADNGFRSLNTAESDYAPLMGSIVSATTINGAKGNLKIATTTVNAAGATSTASNLVPAGCILLGVTTRVTTAITSGDGGTSVNIGNGTDADMYGAAIAFALGTTTNLASHTASALAFVSAAQNVVFTCVGGTFNGGVWRVCAHYLDLTAPTS